MRKHRSLTGAACLLLALGMAGWWVGPTRAPEPRILVFSKTAGFRHASIEAGIAALQKLGTEHHVQVDTTEDASNFNEANLQRYQAVVFLNTTGDVLDQAQQNDFERFIQAGGGYVGIHSATDTEYDWPWYGKLVGAYFLNHPMPDNVQQGTFLVVDKSHPATEGLPDRWERTDEFYSFKEINPDIHVLVKIDESTYRGGENGADHPMAWYHDFDGGRAFYTNMGHTEETFSEPLFLQHLWGGLQYALGGATPVALDYSRARTKRMPEENRFTKVVLAEGLDEPVELALLGEGRVLFVERHGDVNLYDPAAQQVKTIATIPVSHTYTDREGKTSEGEDGLLGVALDPGFAENHWLYLFYSDPDSSRNVLSRFELRGDELVLSSEKEILAVPVQREQCCHTGGSIAFDGAGNLYVSTGDNTNPHATGYAPIDERPGRGPWDAQKSSANTNDLRGKILRIHPEPDGSYTIPEGNLFPPGTPGTRPEIYTMGHRNPYRIAVDPKTGFLYWGDVGPDANRDSVDRGPAGHDEVGQARQAGNFGWPYFVGDNKPYHDYDFAMRMPGPAFDPAHLVNDSPNNTGLAELPPAQPAFIWYPAAASPEFPLVGSGGRTAMAGPVFYAEDFAGAERAFPDYYDGKLFIYEWMRGWIMAVTMDEEGNYVSMERFMPSYRFSNPIDMAFADDGDLYLLEYGSGWFQANEDARLVRIEYNGGNRKPVARLTVDKKAGALPLQVQLSSAGTEDFDGDSLTYAWTIAAADGTPRETFSEANPAVTFDEPGVYKATLTVKDAQGEQATATTEVVAGNETPEVDVRLTKGNQTFFFPAHTIEYVVNVQDKEDGSLEGGQIAPEQVAVTIDYLREGFDQVAIAQGHRSADASASVATGQKLIEGSDCQSCHKVEGPSIGPALLQVAQKYKGDSGAVAHLTTKILEGGAGVWGDVMMPPHPQLSPAEATQMVEYILSLAEAQQQAPSLPVAGTYTTEAPQGGGGQGTYVLRAAYTDRGAEGIPPATGEDVLVLRSPFAQASEADQEEDVQRFKPPDQPFEIVIGSRSGSYIGFDGVDLTDVSEVVFGASAPAQGLPTAGGHVEVRLDAPDGALIGESTPIKPSPGFGNGELLRAPIEPTAGPHDVFFVFKNDEAPPQQPLFILTTVQFLSGDAPAVQAAGPDAQSQGAQTAAPAGAAGPSGLSTRSKLKDLFANEQARTILEKHLPGLTTDARIEQAMEMSLRDLAPYAPEFYTEQALQAIDEDLAEL